MDKKAVLAAVIRDKGKPVNFTEARVSNVYNNRFRVNFYIEEPSSRSILPKVCIGPTYFVIANDDGTVTYR